MSCPEPADGAAAAASAFMPRRYPFPAISKLFRISSSGRWKDRLDRTRQVVGEVGYEELAALSTLVGTLLLARATRGTDLSDRILAAGHATLAPDGSGRAEG
jgi:hypothetical protein